MMRDDAFHPLFSAPLNLTEREELEQLRQQVAQMTPVWQAHQRKIIRQKITRAIRRLWANDPGQRARLLIEAHRQGLPATKPDWQELAALLDAPVTDPPTMEVSDPLDGEALLQQAERFLEQLAAQAQPRQEQDNISATQKTARKTPVSKGPLPSAYGPILPLSVGMTDEEGQLLPRRIRREMARQAVREAKKQLRHHPLG